MNKIKSAVFSLLILNFLTYAGMNTETLVSKKTVKIKCTEMTCDGCKRSITKSINSLKGIEKLNIDLETKIITVEFDDSGTDEQSIVNAVIEAGYDAELLK
jgi:copper chaperone CopZ